jgi:L-2,4-diaminobutyric acid acetyltransferase
VDDAGAVWALVRESGVLDVNSSYCYLVLCKYFKETSVVVRQGDRLAGFLTALLPPADGSRLFVWQVGVSAADRGHGLAKQMLRHLLTRPVCRGVTHLETTVSPGNIPSRALFASLARELNTSLQECETYAPQLFPEPDHEPEQRLLLGPFDTSVLERP